MSDRKSPELSHDPPPPRIDPFWIILALPLAAVVLACVLHPEYVRPMGPRGNRAVTDLLVISLGALGIYSISYCTWFSALLSMSSMTGRQSDDTQAGCAVQMIRAACVLTLYLLAFSALTGRMAP
ncbi:MAG TPA: hypothetical protein PLU72_03200 [Candidatus Ozemobacteraceae bacterium]|nr:hypothetical protein [Candidatus Ozemobacteraceae bacterium]HQG27617.1 hypothetical protein [Candidatus Ozemobacteraceae bacterium]